MRLWRVSLNLVGVVFVVASVSLKGLCACFSVRRKYCVSFNLRAVASVLASFSLRDVALPVCLPVSGKEAWPVCLPVSGQEAWPLGRGLCDGQTQVLLPMTCVLVSLSSEN